MSRFLRLILLPIAVLAILWIGVWWYAESRLVVAFHQRVAWLRQAGWTVAHGAVTRGSSPMMARLDIDHLSLTLPGLPGARPTIVLPHIGVVIYPSAPFTIVSDLPLLWHASMPDGNGVDLAFQSISTRYHIDPDVVFGGPRELDFSGETTATDMRINSAASNFTLLSVASFSGRFHANLAADAKAVAYSVHDRITGIAVSKIFVELLHLPFDGQIRRLDFDLTISGPHFPLPHLAAATTQITPADPAAVWRELAPQYRPWAQEGGHGSLAMNFAVGPLRTRIGSKFGFDQDLQPEGSGTIHADGFGQFLAAIADQGQLAANIASRLTTASAPYLVKGKDGTQQLVIDFALQHRVLSVNGKPVQTLPRLEWPEAGSQPAPPATH